MRTGLIKNKDETEVLMRMNRRIKAIYFLLGVIILSSVIFAMSFIFHENKLTVPQPTDQQCQAVLDFSNTTNYTEGIFYLLVGLLNTVAFSILVHFMNKYFDAKKTKAQR